MQKDMDYLEIIRKGYFDETERENLPDYLLEQYHKAESKTMTLKRFFDGCFNAVEALNKDIETKIIKRKEELINWAENSENNKDHYIGELKAINIDNFTTTLPQGGQLRAKDIDFIHEAIQAAKVKAQTPTPTPGKPQHDSSKPETLSDFITHENSVDIAERIKNQYKGIRGKDLKILFLALNELQLLPPGRIAAKFYRCCKNTFDWDIAVPQAVNDYKFKKGEKSKRGNYIQTDDEKELNQMKTFLNEIINDK